MNATLPKLTPDLRSDQAVGLGCIVDTETTGLAMTDEAIELALVLFAFSRSDGSILGIVDSYVGLREPSVPISPGAQQVHGISAAEVAGKRLDYDRVEEILIRTEFIVAHNAPFDRRYLIPLSDTAGEKPWLCSMSGIDWYSKGCRSRALQKLLAGHKIVMPSAHRAMDDVLGVLHLLARSHEGRTHLAELLRLDAHGDKR